MPRSAKSTPQPRSASPKAGTPKTKAPVPKKSDIEAMLLSTQKKLFDAETALEAQTEELATLRTQTSEQQASLSETRDAYYDGLVDVSLAQHQAYMAKKGEATAITEMRHMTQLLAEAERATAAANTASADQSALNAAMKDISDLRSKLSAADSASKDVDALRKRVAEQDQRLEITAREMADLTALLDKSETDKATSAAYGASLKVGRAAVTALIAPPDTERLDQGRINRAATALVDSGTFDPDWYLTTYQDVADSGVDPTLHFLEFGFAEGRAPKAAQ